MNRKKARKRTADIGRDAHPSSDVGTPLFLPYSRGSLFSLDNKVSGRTAVTGAPTGKTNISERSKRLCPARNNDGLCPKATAR